MQREEEGVVARRRSLALRGLRADELDELGEMSLQFEVIDKGPGVDAADSARIFQPFFTTKATGTGLGLALVQRTADTLGGVVAVTPAPSGGSIFTLQVPLEALPRD